MYSDVQYTESEVVFRKAYGIGEGLKITYEELSNAASCQQNETGCNVVTDFILPVKVKGKINVSLIKEDNTPEKNSDNNTQVTAAETGTVTLDNFNGVTTFNCPEPGCVKVYASYRALENHVLVGVHDVRLQKESVYDFIKNKRPMGHIAHLRKQFKSINTYDYIITMIKKRKKIYTMITYCFFI